MDTPTHAQGPLDAADLSGRELGGYRLVSRLGSGGMGDVYLGEQKSLGRRVAVKVLRPEAVRHPGAVERFEREARAAAALTHGNIVQIHEVACIDGIHVLVEEYVAGPSLGDWLATRGPLDPRQALSVLVQVGSALERAAAQGVVHRDIKPENLLVTPTGEVKVADFGLARVLSEDVGLTQSGTTLGTPLYMSPEQAQGNVADVRSDLYSLGATVYHLLAGRPPFDGPVAVSVMLKHVSEPPVSLATLRPDLPVRLCEIVERLLAKEPAARYGSPADLVHEAADVVAALPARSPRGPAPLAWEAEVGAWRHASGVGPRGAATDAVRVRQATRHLQAVLGRAIESRSGSRRRWLATLAVAAAAAAAGFGAGRLRARRSALGTSLGTAPGSRPRAR